MDLCLSDWRELCMYTYCASCGLLSRAIGLSTFLHYHQKCLLWLVKTASRDSFYRATMLERRCNFFPAKLRNYAHIHRWSQNDQFRPGNTCGRHQTLVADIGADTDLKLGAQTPATELFSLPPNLRCAPPPPIPVAQRGHTTVEKSILWKYE